MERVASHVGINVGDTRYTDLDYADDFVLFGNSIQELGSALQQFHTIAGHLGLRLSWQKTKVQNLGAGDDVGDVTICGQTVEGVSKFVYLGSQQSSMDRCTDEVLRRIGIASSAMNSMQRVWRHQGLSTETKFRPYRVCILSILLYGSECWTLPREDLRRLEAFHTNSHRQILYSSGSISSAMTKF